MTEVLARPSFQRSFVPVVALLLALSALPATALSLRATGTAAAAPARYMPGEVIVRFDPASSLARRAAVRAALGATFTTGLGLPGLQLLELPAGMTVTDAVQKLEDRSGVLFAQPNFIGKTSAIPNDPKFKQQWALNNTGAIGTLKDADIDAVEAWDTTTGSPDVTVAVVDSGVAYDHPDLAPNMIGGNGRDFVENDDTPLDGTGHGTSVAGVIAAAGNNALGISGVSWSSKIMALRVVDSGGAVTDATTAQAMAYAVANGAKIVNVSLVFADNSQAMSAVIQASPNTLFVASAGNVSKDNDQTPMYPCNYTHANVICVGATTANDRMLGFSNFGATSVDLGAPGDDIVTTIHSPTGVYTGNETSSRSGTSFAAPFVSGVAALLWSHRPAATVPQVRNALLTGVDPLTSLEGKTVTGGRLNALKALRVLDPSIPEESAGGGPGEHARTITLTLTKHLVAKGKLAPSDGFGGCTGSGFPLVIKRNGRKVAGTQTKGGGAFSVKLKDRPGTYQAVAGRSPSITSFEHKCGAATSAKRKHKH